MLQFYVLMVTKITREKLELQMLACLVSLLLQRACYVLSISEILNQDLRIKFQNCIISYMKLLLQKTLKHNAKQNNKTNEFIITMKKSIYIKSRVVCPMSKGGRERRVWPTGFSSQSSHHHSSTHTITIITVSQSSCGSLHTER